MGLRYSNDRLEFDEPGETPGGTRQGVDGIRLMRQGAPSGVRSTVAAGGIHHGMRSLLLRQRAGSPEGYGGRQMAVLVGQHARAGIVPDWIQDASPK